MSFGWPPPHRVEPDDSPYVDPPRHEGQRVQFALHYADLLDKGEDPVEARKKALGIARLWRMYYEMGILENQKEVEAVIGKPGGASKL